ncbi:bifunctional diaminohydroxyphosphoribosylaminopyrimidine deaminase/5-amino-6-(5-phosphoribosylamino)uracil reductase RibD [Phycicoccus sp. SLBN-51]|uniref:bifunctional diaminohydroxyphosphoribosylaminopyrimidine deaminase/5-amino-6-(5-phosphoribosylamino)uracil reductase RibD n=1 Tax=Phycicoccus sp. SLBN-51 TaxID=2768447 RepID=UPI001154BE25|nr:bifunctional diaminohydroxyphosphoribosylaminopyrimidine deaminase/5-amino-6-(5-phosphoribosylamino)uracil reductase RibD [Phycicoccus sp. SLBN-51]TQJ51040.1 diaminohydroxyphosphoribosylaminopyrimidine deaminase/5-amino-6-(5-phosphoribosylamino)uracil reductase [Phycicoccus sp. SLBN-51]
MQQRTTDQQATDIAHLRRALELAAQGPVADPNPRVGCVVTDAAGEVVGEGWHRGAGTAHAEIDALAQAGDRARGGTAYVTLEPCNHTGRTQPCSDALYAAGLARVVHAQSDPNPRAAGGAEVLRGKGVEVTGGVLADEAQALNRSWTHLVTTGRPWVTWKLAATLDGRSAAADGTSQWITGEAARADVHRLRAECGAILVGTGTALVDDPQLTARWPDGTLYPRQPIRVVMGERDLPATARVLDDAAPTWHLRTRDPKVVLQALADAEVHRLWLEGGPTVAAAFLSAGLVDEVVAYVAPVLLGRGRQAVTDLGITTIDAALRLRPTDITLIGDDVRITADLREGLERHEALWAHEAAGAPMSTPTTDPTNTPEEH